MNTSAAVDTPERVAVLAPVGRDAAVVAQLLAVVEVTSVITRDVGELVATLAEGAGAVLLTEEALTRERVAELVESLQAQPSWSDLPVLLLLASGDRDASRPDWPVDALRAAGNVTLLQRPLPGLTLLTAVQSALRARRRQYQLRELIAAEQRARGLAEAATRIKDEFLATVSHELRTPLSAISLWSNLLASGHAEVDEAVQAIERSARAQSQLIEDLLDLSRMLAGQLRVRLREDSLAPVARAAALVVQPMAAARGVQLGVDIDADAGSVLADPDRMQQVLWNLLSNAVKFTPEGGRVTLRLWRSHAHVHVQVADTGIGISAEFLPHVFERFRQADATTSREQGGLGLGLAIARQLVELHGGTLHADSPGEYQGARFTLALPLVRAEAVTAVHAAAPRILAALRVLLVEDEPDTRLALAGMLEDAGAEVTAVDSAAAARAAFTGSEPTRRPQVLISDIGLPGEDGNALLRSLRAEQARRREPALPAAAISAYTPSSGRRDALAAGFDDYLVKPITADALVAAVLALAALQDPITPCSSA